jgi:hypothetical protein
MVEEYYFLGCDTIQYGKNYQHLGGICRLEDGGSSFPLKSSKLLPDYMMSQPRKQYC